MLDNIDLAGADAEAVSDLFHGPFFNHVAIEDLEVFGINLSFHAVDGGVKELAFPFLVPDGIQLDGGGVGDAFEAGSLGGFAGDGIVQFDAAILFAQMVVDASAGDEQEPGFEGADGRVVFEVRHLAGDGDDGVLDNVLGLGFTQASAEGDAVNQFPISVEEVLPAFLVVPLLQTAEQRAARWYEFGRVHLNRRGRKVVRGGK